MRYANTTTADVGSMRDFRWLHILTIFNDIRTRSLVSQQQHNNKTILIMLIDGLTALILITPYYCFSRLEKRCFSTFNHRMFYRIVLLIFIIYTFCLFGKQL